MKASDTVFCVVLIHDGGLPSNEWLQGGAVADAHVSLTTAGTAAAPPHLATRCTP